MTPGAQAQAAIELLTEIASGNRPADECVAGYFRKRRYAGGGDRRTITDLLYTVLRRRAQLDWWLDHAGMVAHDERARVIATLLLDRRMDEVELAGAFDGGRYRPAPLTSDERALVAVLIDHTMDHPDQSDTVRANLPGWVTARLVARFGEAASGECAALALQAPVTLRVNTLKANRQTVLAAMRADRIDAVPTSLSPIGICLSGRQPMGGLAVYRDGLIEPQDEASQVAALLVDARPGMTVVDFCAGGGGKTLVLAATMANQGRLIACDLSEARLRPMSSRLARAGVSIVEARALAGLDDPWIAENSGVADRVLVDAPCSGSGAWRRNPAAKWRLSLQDLDDHVARQREILGRASRLVRAGGNLVYATCSLFAEEDEEQVEWFLERHPAFTLAPIPNLWATALGGACPTAAPYLTLTPARHGTDGFFVAVFQRQELRQ